jgi:phosphate-selective porin OprO/OprP
MVGYSTLVQAQEPNLDERVKTLEESLKTVQEQNKSEAMRVFWRNDLRFQTLDKQVEIRIGGRIQLDWNFYWPDNELEAAFGDPEDRIFFRRARLGIRGTLYDFIQFKAEYDFADEPADGVNFADVYIQFIKIPYVGAITLGQFKVPFGLEELTSSRFITFQERSLTDAFVLAREIGAMFHNEVFDGRMTWALAVTRPEDDFGDTILEGSFSGDYNVTLRLTGLPWMAADNQLTHVGFAYSFRNPPNNELRYRARPEARIDGLRLVDTGTLMVREVHQFGFEGAVVYGPFSAQSEFMLALPQSVMTDTPGLDDPTFWAWYMYASYFLTGEHRAYEGGIFGRVKPKRNLNLKTGGFGAFEVAARFSWIDLDDAFDFDQSTGGKQRDFTFGVNWYPNPNTRVIMNYVYANVDRTIEGDETFDLDGSNAHIFQMRFQVDF